VKLGIAGIILLAASCCPTRPPPSCPDRTDASETPEEISSGRVACARAGERLAELKCKQARPDFVDFCVHMISSGVPICPVKLARIKTCAEVDTICR